MTPLLKRLEQRDLLQRARLAEDERVVRLRLTNAGRALRAKAANVPGRLICGLDIDRAIAVTATGAQESVGDSGGSGPASDNRPEFVTIVGLGDVVIHARCQAILPVALHHIGGYRNDG